jgi:hypothetical protein
MENSTISVAAIEQFDPGIRQRREEVSMVYIFEPENYQVVDKERGISIKSVHTGAGIGWRRIFHFTSPEVNFFFYAKIMTDDPTPVNADHWSLDGVARDSKENLFPIEMSEPLLTESFREISAALQEIRFLGTGFSRDGEPVRQVEFDLNIRKPKQTKPSN